MIQLMPVKNLRTGTLGMAGLALLSIHCGGGGDPGALDEGPPGATEGTAQPFGARSTVDAVGALMTALEQQDADSVGVLAMRLSHAGWGVVDRSGPIDRPIAAQQPIAEARWPGTVGTARCTPGGCTFDGYGNETGTFTGSVGTTDEAGGKHVVWTLTGRDVGREADERDVLFSYVLRGDLTTASTRITGAAGVTWSGDGMVAGQPVTFGHGGLVKFEGVVLTSSCPTGGDVFGKWWNTRQGSGQPRSEVVQGTHTFDRCVYY
jgi:hypothetical protein